MAVYGWILLYISIKLLKKLYWKRIFNIKGVEKLRHENILDLFLYILLAVNLITPILKVRDYLLSYWIHNDKQIDYFLIDYCFKLVVCNDADFSRYMNAHPLNGIDRFKLIELMNTPYNEIIKMKSINVIVGI
ncbi:hypothetical protein BANRA_01700 [Escherichia coli]|nr:hypothetical protein BANRA_01700 [Escherichia coli]